MPSLRLPAHWPIIAIATICVAIAILMFVLYRDLRHDDAYITFQYARHVGEGNGFVFNAGEHILGTTTPLFTLILAVVYRVFGDVLAHAAIAISVVSLSVQAVLLWCLLRNGGRISAAAIAVASALGLGGMWASLGLETCLYGALVLATIAAMTRKRDVLAGVCLGLAFLTRYDAALLVLVVVGWFALERRAVPVRLLLASAVVVAPWLVFAQLYFGSVLPHTLGAKTGLTSTWMYLGHYWDLAISAFGGLDRSRLGSALALSCLLLGLRWIWLVARAMVPLVAYACGHAFVYAWIGPSEQQHWHMYIPVLVTRVVILLGVLGTIEHLADGARGAARSRLRVAAVACGLLAIGNTARQLAHHASTYRDDYWLGVRHAAYERVAVWLAENVAPRASLLSTEVGTLGYLTRRRMIDPTGLVTETNDWPRTLRVESKLQLARQYSADAILFDIVEETRPAQQELGYRVVHVFPWQSPWFAIAVRDPNVLAPAARSLWDQATPR